MALLEIRDLKKYFSTPRGMLHAVDEVNLDIEEGTTLGVVGESGCGKSTLGRTVIRLLEPTSGTVMFDGKDITSVTKRQFHALSTQMQMIFQDPYASLDPRMSVAELIAEPIKVHQLTRNRAEISERVRDLMDTVGLARRLERSYPHELDGGRRQRIGIARALALNPKFIVCDEPVSALDVSIQAQILNLLQDLQQEKKLTYMFITHNLSVVRHISNEICVMYLGRVVEKCEAKELFVHPYHPYTKALLSAIPIPNIHIEQKPIPMTGELTSPINPPNACRFAPRCPYATEQCRSSEPALEEMTPGHVVLCHRAKELNDL